MANFNPVVQPTNDPNFGGDSRPIDIPDSIRPRGAEENRILPKGQELGDKSAEYLGKAAGYAAEGEAVATKGFGDLFAGIVGIGDFMAKAGVQMVKKDIEDKVYQVADAERQRYTAELEKIKTQGGGSAAVGSANLLDAHAEMTETPDEVAELPESLETLQSANSAGKLSKTDYNGRLLALAKDMRARYPGFKQEIDQEFAKVTGVNPANAYITNLIQSINRQSGAVNSEQNKLQTYIMGKTGFQGAQEASAKVASGEWTRQDVIKWAAPQEQFRIAIENKNAIFQSEKQDRETQDRNGRELVAYATQGVVMHKVNDFLNKTNLNSLADAESMDARSKAGGISAQQWVQTGDEWQNEILRTEQAMRVEAQRTGVTKKIGAKAVEEEIKLATKPMYDVKDRIYAKDSGGIYKTAQSIRAMGDEDQKRLLEDSIVGGDFRGIETMKRIGGEPFLASENLRKIVNGLPDKYGQYQDRFIKALQTQTDMKNAGVPVTLNRAFDEFKVKMKNATEGEKRKMNASMIDEITRIADPKVPDAIKENYALSAFSPANRGFISRLNVDATDSQGRPIQGQNAVFQKLTSPEITKEMYRLGQTNPTIWKNYVDWTKETLGNELVSKEMRYLGEIRNPAISVGWDSDNKRLVTSYNSEAVRKDPMVLRSREPDAEYNLVVNAVNRINSNFANYKNVAMAQSKNTNDVDAFMLGTIVQAVGPQALANVQSIPGDIARQIGLTQLKKKSSN